MEDRQRLAQLEARARMLEAELAGLNATIATLRARLSTRYAPAAATAAFAPVGIPSVPPPPPQEFQSPIPSPQPPPAAALAPDVAVQAEPAVVAQPEDGVYLPPLPPYDSLRQKWDIGTGEASVANPQPPVYAAASVAEPVQYAADPELRLFGLLTDGSPWEYRIPFSCMAAEGGICIGRDATYSHVILNDGSVSRCHMRLELTEQGIVVSDLNTTNGSLINDHVIEEYENRLPLNDGDTLTLGNVTLQAQFLQ